MMGHAVPQKTTSNVAVGKYGPKEYRVEVDGIDTSECTILVTSTQLYGDRSIDAAAFRGEIDSFLVTVNKLDGFSSVDFTFFSFLVTCIN